MQQLAHSPPMSRIVSQQIRCAIRHSPLSSQPLQKRLISSVGAAQGETVEQDARLNAPHPPRSRPLSETQRKFLDSALRVNHAGELAATLIYTAQTPPILKSHPHLRPLMRHMYDQEAGHFKHFNHLMAKHRIRPTAMYPVWQAAATALGWSTGVLGREAAMACTEAVETEIGEHYNAQVRELLAWEESCAAKGEEIGAEMSEMIKEIRRIRDEELEHLDHAVENDAKEAKPYELLTGIIRAGCRGAIWVSEKV